MVIYHSSSHQTHAPTLSLSKSLHRLYLKINGSKVYNLCLSFSQCHQSLCLNYLPSVVVKGLLLPFHLSYRFLSLIQQSKSLGVFMSAARHVYDDLGLSLLFLALMNVSSATAKTPNQLLLRFQHYLLR